MSDDKKLGRHSADPQTRAEAVPEDLGTRLSDADMARIRAEEEFRAQVRAESASQPLAASSPPLVSKDDKKAPQQNLSAAKIIVFFALAGGIWWLSQPQGITTTGKTVVYAVASSCPADVTYTVNGMDTQQEQGVPSGWTKTVQASSLTNTLIAQLTCDGNITVGIQSGSSPSKMATSSGEYAIASVGFP